MEGLLPPQAGGPSDPKENRPTPSTGLHPPQAEAGVPETREEQVLLHRPTLPGRGGHSDPKENRLCSRGQRDSPKQAAGRSARPFQLGQPVLPGLMMHVLALGRTQLNHVGLNPTLRKAFLVTLYWFESSCLGALGKSPRELSHPALESTQLHKPSRVEGESPCREYLRATGDAAARCSETGLSRETSSPEPGQPRNRRVLIGCLEDGAPA